MRGRGFVNIGYHDGGYYTPYKQCLGTVRITVRITANTRSARIASVSAGGAVYIVHPQSHCKITIPKENQKNPRPTA